MVRMMPRGAFRPDMTGPGGTFCLAEGCEGEVGVVYKNKNKGSKGYQFFIKFIEQGPHGDPHLCSRYTFFFFF